MDSFEKFLQEKRAGLDHIEDVPTAAIWRRIQQGRQPNQQPSANIRVMQQRKIRRLQAWVIGLAASVLILLVGGIAFWPKANHQTAPIEYFDNPLAMMSDELADTEQHFKQLIAQQESEIDWQQIDRQLFSEIFEELELLEKLHLEYQQDIPEFRDKEQLIHTLTRYYEQKIRILERLSKEIEQQHHYQKKIYEKDL